MKDVPIPPPKEAGPHMFKKFREWLAEKRYAMQKFDQIPFKGTSKEALADALLEYAATKAARLTTGMDVTVKLGRDVRRPDGSSYYHDSNVLEAVTWYDKEYGLMCLAYQPLPYDTFGFIKL